MDKVAEYGIMLVAGWASGVSIYFTVAFLGIAGRAGWVTLPGNLVTLENPLIIAAALFLACIEFVADKVPFVDSMWDGVHTFIRPAGAVVLGLMAGTEAGPIAQTLFALLTGSIALDSHAVKATTRLAINTSPEPFSNVAASLAEGAALLFVFWLFVKHPLLACLLVLAFVVGSFFILRALWGFARRLFRRQAPAGAGT